MLQNSRTRSARPYMRHNNIIRNPYVGAAIQTAQKVITKSECPPPR